jgi:hypothetical protein
MVNLEFMIALLWFPVYVFSVGAPMRAARVHHQRQALECKAKSGVLLPACPEVALGDALIRHQS